MASNRHSDPFRPTWSERLRGSGGLWVSLGLAVFAISAVTVVLLVSSGEPTQVEARLIRFGSQATELGDVPILVVRLEDGTLRHVRARRADARACRVGRTVRLLRRGVTLRIQPGGCLVP